MQLNYSKLGEYIELVSHRNTDLHYGESDVRGVSNNKEIIKTRADNKLRAFDDFYVVAPNEFIYNSRTSRMGDKVGLGFNDKGKTFTTSFNNTVFRVKNESLLPKYLFMWFNRPEFDRYARFHSWGSSTELFPWSDMCNIDIPVPSIEKQRAIVKEYNTIVNRIKLNEKLNQKLEETAQALYKHWFVDFEFPNENGQPYNSSGGEMVYNEGLDQEIPVCFQYLKISELTKTVLGGTPSRLKNEYWGGNIPWINSGKVNDLRVTTPAEYITKEGLGNSSTKLLPKNTVVLAITGATLGQVSIVDIKTCANQSVIGVLETENLPFEFLYLSVNQFITELLKSQTGGAQPHINKNDVNNLNIIYHNKIVILFKDLIKPIFELISNNCLQNDSLLKVKQLLLSKISKVESKKTTQVL